MDLRWGSCYTTCIAKNTVGAGRNATTSRTPFHGPPFARRKSPSPISCAIPTASTATSTAAGGAASHASTTVRPAPITACSSQPPHGDADGLLSFISRSTGFPPRHDPLVLALVTAGARRDDPAAERDARRALRTHAVAAPGVRSRAARRIGVVVGAVHDGEAVGALVAHFHHVLRHGDPLARDLQHGPVHPAAQDRIPRAVPQSGFTFVVALRGEPQAGPAQDLFHNPQIAVPGPGFCDLANTPQLEAW